MMNLFAWVLVVLPVAGLAVVLPVLLWDARAQRRAAATSAEPQPDAGLTPVDVALAATESSQPSLVQPERLPAALAVPRTTSSARLRPVPRRISSGQLRKVAQAREPAAQRPGSAG